MNNTKVFLITGVSSGLGRAFAQAALAAGHTVVGKAWESISRSTDFSQAIRARYPS
jgi:NAD(P)-dependent dehydrogenase (short-subunit alcohol dehydrogenase family)